MGLTTSGYRIATTVSDWRTGLYGLNEETSIMPEEPGIRWKNVSECTDSSFARAPNGRTTRARAKGTQTPHSDVDLTIFVNVGALRAEAMAAELDELPLP